MVDINDVALEMVLRSCPALQTLCFDQVFGVTETAYELVGTLCPHLRSFSVILPGAEFDDNTLFRVCQGCPQLRCLVLEDCDGISSVGLCTVIRACPLLEMLHLSRCSGVTDAVLLALSKYSAGLNTANLTNCRGITTAGVEALKRGCHLLKEITLRRCDNVSAEAKR
jgi:hypothetical protein